MTKLKVCVFQGRHAECLRSRGKSSLHCLYCYRVADSTAHSACSMYSSLTSYKSHEHKKHSIITILNVEFTLDIFKMTITLKYTSIPFHL